MKIPSSLGVCALATTLLMLAACGGPSASSPGAAPERTLPPTITVEVGGTVISGPAILESPEQAQELVSFPVLVADAEVLPAGLELEEVDWQPYPEENTELVTLSYRDAENTMDLTIQQIDLGGRRTAPPSQPHEEIIVRGTTGYLLSFEHAEGQEPVALSWEENGTIVSVSTSGMTLEQTLRIVESMSPVGK